MNAHIAFSASIGAPQWHSQRSLYCALRGEHAHAQRAAAQQYLHQQLQAAAALPGELPADPAALPTWAANQLAAVGRHYQDYLQRRRQGEMRAYFSNRAHALYFLQSVAPTKLVDGAWLYGLLEHWQTPQYAALIRTYCEELGDGHPERNHVALYKKLLDSHGCDGEPVDDLLYTQGAIQLALAYNTTDFLPEVIGFNLGYEQLPLHLLITAHELTELGIDPYYFSLHVTIDNLASGHASKAIGAVRDSLAASADRREFYRRVHNGYRLNALGRGSVDVIEAFDIEREVIAMLARKSEFGKLMHSDRCRIGGRSLSDWLARPQQIPELLDTFQHSGWIRRGEDPANSRFWRLLDGDKPAMFGVFTDYEQQLLWDWIAAGCGAQRPVSAGISRSAASARTPWKDSSAAPSIERRNQRGDKEAALRRLIAAMAPHRHHTAAGLAATRQFRQWFDQ